MSNNSVTWCKKKSMLSLIVGGKIRQPNDILEKKSHVLTEVIGHFTYLTQSITYVLFCVTSSTITQHYCRYRHTEVCFGQWIQTRNHPRTSYVSIYKLNGISVQALQKVGPYTFVNMCWLVGYHFNCSVLYTFEAYIFCSCYVRYQGELSLWTADQNGVSKD